MKCDKVVVFALTNEYFIDLQFGHVKRQFCREMEPAHVIFNDDGTKGG